MHLDSVVMDAIDPASQATFWARALRTEVAEQSQEGARLRLPGGPELWFDLVPVSEIAPRPHRIHLDLYAGERYGGPGRDALVADLLAHGAAHVDIGQAGTEPWVVLVDPEDNAFCVMPDREGYVSTGPIASLPIDADDPAATFAFYRDATGWVGTDEENVLRHPSMTGPQLGFCDPEGPKTAKNPIHLDLRVDAESDYDVELERLLSAGARRLDHDWGPLPWTVLVDPGGNELCLLPARPAQHTAQ